MSHAEHASQPSPSAKPRRPAWLHSPYKPPKRADRVEHNALQHWLREIAREISRQHAAQHGQMISSSRDAR